MNKILLPPVWIIVILAGLPQLSETVYTPSLPDIAKTLIVPHSYVEYTLTIYLAGFAIGILFWGWLSDRFGRKMCILAGMLIFIIGSIGCYSSDSIELLMWWRFIQGFGGSVGSVLGQAVCRDAFHGNELSRVYASVVGALAIFPAVGPIVGGFIVQHYLWSHIFVFLAFAAAILFIIIIFYLPETHHKDNRVKLSLLKIFKLLIFDKRVMILAVIVAGCNGIFFSYFAEGPFYLIQILGLTPQQFGFSFIPIACAIWFGGVSMKYLRQRYSNQFIIKSGIQSIIYCSAFLGGAVTFAYFDILDVESILVYITIASLMGIMFGFCLSVSNALSMALIDYKWCIGTASSIFGFIYYCLISLITFVMGAVHNHTLFAMPLYFLSIGILMFLAFRFFPKD
jgi:MFS transporter, DHA1 family, multidrug resistance protein